MQSIITGRNSPIKLAHYDETNKRVHDSQMVRAKESKKEGKDHELIQSSTNPDPGHYMGK